MRFHKALYLKELRQHRNALAVYFALSILVVSMRWLHGSSWDVMLLSEKRTFFLHWLEIGMGFYLPVLLVYSWVREQRGKTSYQLLSIPVKSPAILLHKYLAFVTTAITASLMYIPGRLQLQSDITTDHPVLMGFALILMLPLLQITGLSIATLVIGNAQEHHKHPLLHGLVNAYSANVFFPLIFLAPLVIIASSSLKIQYMDDAFKLLLIVPIIAVMNIVILRLGLSTFEKNIDG